MNLTDSIAPRSDQWNADDLVGGPVTFTIREVVKGKAEQPFDFLVEGSDRAFRPGVTMRRLIVAAWGADANTYVGKRLTVYRDPTIRFGSAVVGGIRISHMSGLDKPLVEKFQTTRGKRETFTVDPLPDTPPPDPNAARIAELRNEWDGATDERKAAIKAEVAALQVQS